MNMKRTKELYQETIFATEDEKKKFENYNRWMNYHAQGPESSVYDFDKELNNIRTEVKEELQYDTI